MKTDKKINVGIGFATGRKNFQKVLNSHIYNLKESGLTEKFNVSLNLYVCYDLSYNNTRRKDFTNIHKDLFELIERADFIGKQKRIEETDLLIEKKVLSAYEAGMIFGRGYAAQRNEVLYSAIKDKMDYLIFFDDDEYPVAVTNTRQTAVWGGQHVLTTHLKYIANADITHGHHCGYISPIPCVEYNEKLSEDDFRNFIEAISNDILNWEKIKSVMNDGGVTYADTNILTGDKAVEVKEVKKTKFISGANLCINITDPLRVNPFYNPPKARGEDTFLSACLSERKVLRVPCYTFHDGFSTYKRLLEGVLPIRLKSITADNQQVKTRFYNACIGWIRYKPLLLYITQPKLYEAKIAGIKEKLQETLPKICDYFGMKDFVNIYTELVKYDNNVEKHYREFLETQHIWQKIMEYLASVTPR